MLQHTFIHVPGIGPHRERELWRRGFVDWPTFARRHPPGPWRDLIVSRLDPRRAREDLPRREAWRLFPSFRGRVAYLDIETEGLHAGRKNVTCVGVSDGRRAEAFLKGRNLHRLPGALRRFDMLVTYGGSSFDLPVLREVFPRIDFDRFHHVDLRYPLGRLGFTGGLKHAETRIGLQRDAEVRDVDGYLAIQLWRAHRAGRRTALSTLARYCLEDTVSLQPLMAHVYNTMVRAMPIPIDPVVDGKRPRIPFRADGELVRELRARSRYPESDPW